MSNRRRDNESSELIDDAEMLRQTMRRCADELDEATALKVGVMDSESKAHAVNTQRMNAMLAVAEKLREAALA